ncbi:MAG TPA: Fic family protein [Cyclobacteriaceae bacterium]|nr:Fic family protein [Cyclobacteriaceae bacterium]
MSRYIHLRSGWPDFKWESERLLGPLAALRAKQGHLLGRLESFGFKLKEEASLQTLTLDVVKSSEIEGENLPEDQVRSSIARRLGLEVARVEVTDQNVEGVVEMMLDATQKSDHKLTKDRLLGWHSALFPTGRSGIRKIVTGAWRDDAEGPMQVVSGPMGKERVHFEAPKAARLKDEMKRFLVWFNDPGKIDPVLKAAVAHLWFVTVHPFDDGNGRIARALTDLQLARADGSKQRFYSMSAQIRKERKEYYDVLEKTQKETLDITEWLLWFIECLDHALDASSEILSGIMKKATFWQVHQQTDFNDRQRKMIGALLDETLVGKLNNSKWAKMNKVSNDTALRDIQDLLAKHILVKEEGGGRNTSYRIRYPGE